MENMQRQIEQLRAKSQGGGREKIHRFTKGHSFSFERMAKRGSNQGDTDTESAFLMLRICISCIILVAFFASDLFFGNDSVPVFSSTASQIPANITWDQVVGFFSNLSFDSIFGLFK